MRPTRFYFIWFKLDPRIATSETSEGLVGKPHLLLGPGPNEEEADTAIMFTAFETVLIALRSINDESAVMAFLACDPRIVEATEPYAFRAWLGRPVVRGLFTSGTMAVMGGQIQDEHAAMFDAGVPVAPLLYAAGDA